MDDNNADNNNDNANDNNADNNNDDNSNDDDNNNDNDNDDDNNRNDNNNHNLNEHNVNENVNENAPDVHLIEDGDDDDDPTGEVNETEDEQEEYKASEANETEDEQEAYEASDTDLDETPGVDDDPGETTGVDGMDNTGVPSLETVPNEDSNDEEHVMAEMDHRYGPQNHHYDLQPQKPWDYSHLHADLEHIALTQYNVKKGLKIFGEAGAQVVVTEMQQLHDHDVIIPKHVHMLTWEEKCHSLQYLMFLKQKGVDRLRGMVAWMAGSSMYTK